MEMMVNAPNWAMLMDILALGASVSLGFLGVVLYHALAGPTERRCFLAFTRGPLPDLREAAPGVSAHLAEIVMKAMAYDPAARWPSAGPGPAPCGWRRGPARSSPAGPPSAQWHRIDQTSATRPSR